MTRYRIRFTHINNPEGDQPETHEFEESDDSHARAYLAGFLDAHYAPVQGFDDGVQADLETGYGEVAREV